MKQYNMWEMLEYSRGVCEATDLLTIKNMIDGCASVEKTDSQMDRAGVDYIATLRKGATILIDAKTRTPGCSKYWRNGPELALEVWSVKPENGATGKAGWTVCEAKNVDYIFFTFDLSDSDNVFLYPYQLLRMTFRQNYPIWKTQGYKVDTQSSGSWKSECIFVPESVVWAAMRLAMTGKQVPFIREQAVAYVTNN